MRLRQLLTRQDGITLIMAVGILGVLSVSAVTLIYYSSTNARSAEYSVDNASAYDLAEAGIDEMMAVLSKPTNNGPSIRCSERYRQIACVMASTCASLKLRSNELPLTAISRQLELLSPLPAAASSRVTYCSSHT